MILCEDQCQIQHQQLKDEDHFSKYTTTYPDKGISEGHHTASLLHLVKRYFSPELLLCLSHRGVKDEEHLLSKSLVVLFI